MAFVHVQASDGESAEDEEEHRGEEEPEELEDPNLLSEPSVELSTPKETCAVLVKRFRQLLRAGRHSSGSRFQLAVHAGRMSDSDWQQLQRIVGKEVGWSIERHRITSDQYDVKACYHREQPDLAVLEAGTAAAPAERPLERQQALFSKLDSQSRSAVKRAHGRMETEVAPPPSAAEGAKSARRVVAKHLWLLARRSRSCQVDELIEQVLEHSDLSEEAVLAAVEQIVIRRDKLQRHLVRLEGDNLTLVPPAT